MSAERVFTAQIPLGFSIPVRIQDIIGFMPVVGEPVALPDGAVRPMDGCWMIGRIAFFPQPYEELTELLLSERKKGQPPESRIIVPPAGSKVVDPPPRRDGDSRKL